MPVKRRSVYFATLSLLLLYSRSLSATDDLQSVLRQLDAAAASFHTASADVEFDSITTEPIPDTDVQKGTAYFEHQGKSVRMAAHISEFNGKPVPKVILYANGEFELFEPMINQITRFKNAARFESYLLLGFGASGKELADKWNITFDGQETVDGIKTDKLQLIAKDPAVRKTISKVTLWVDPQRDISVKQIFDEGEGQSRVCHYSNFKVNQSLPGDAFKLKTSGKTQVIDR
jgi:outer membrane lipoprotein-sorting protein